MADKLPKRIRCFCVAYDDYCPGCEPNKFVAVSEYARMNRAPIVYADAITKLTALEAERNGEHEAVDCVVEKVKKLEERVQKLQDLRDKFEWIIEMSLDEALGEVRRQGGPEYLLNEAKWDSFYSAKAKIKSLLGEPMTAYEDDNT